MTLHVTGPVWVWLLLAVFGLVAGPFFYSIGRSAAEARTNRRLRKTKRELDAALVRVGEAEAKAVRRGGDTLRAEKLAKIIEAHREQVELIENGVTPDGFTSQDSGEQFNEADKLLYARYQQVMDEAVLEAVADPPQPRVVPAPPAPPIPATPPEA